MDLRLALLVLGAVVVILVFALSRYSHMLDKHIEKIRGLIPRANKNRHSGRRRAPVLDQSSELEPHQEELFNFGSEQKIDEQAEPNQMLTDDQEVLSTEKQALTGQETGEDVVEHKQEEETIATLDDDHHSLRKSTGPFTSLRQIDFWIKLSPAAPVSQADILSNLHNWDKIGFPVQLHALTQEDPHWVDLSNAQGDDRVTDVVASYQLLYRGNPASIADLNTFDEQVTRLGKALNAEKLMMATPEQALDQSLKLAHFFAESCEPLEVSICAPDGQAFMGKLVETSAKQQGLDFMEGEYVRQKRMASSNVVLYRLVNPDVGHFDENMTADAQIRCVTFTMLPALSQTPGRDAKEMLDAVKAFASRVKGEIRVPGEKEFHQDLLLKLRNRVSKLERDTLAAGLEPGGLEIARIFS